MFDATKSRLLHVSLNCPQKARHFLGTFLVVRPAAHVCLCGESPLIARSGEDLAIRQSQGGNELMREADSKASARRTGI